MKFALIEESELDHYDLPKYVNTIIHRPNPNMRDLHSYLYYQVKDNIKFIDVDVANYQYECAKAIHNIDSDEISNWEYTTARSFELESGYLQVIHCKRNDDNRNYNKLGWMFSLEHTIFKGRVIIVKSKMINNKMQFASVTKDDIVNALRCRFLTKGVLDNGKEKMEVYYQNPDLLAIHLLDNNTKEINQSGISAKQIKQEPEKYGKQEPGVIIMIYKKDNKRIITGLRDENVPCDISINEVDKQTRYDIFTQ